MLGRVSGCDIVLEDDKVSRKHARLIVQVGVVEVEDLGSRNGVHINGTRVLRRVLRDGDVLLIGRTEMRFVEAVAPSRPAAPDLAGVDLLADGDEVPAVSSGPAVDDELDLDFGSDEEPVAEVRPPAPPPPSPPRPSAAAKPEPAEEAEVLEFVDEVVEVRKPAKPAPSAKGAPSAGAARSLPDRDRGVLQFHKNVQARGGLGEDVGQLGGLRKAVVVALGILAAAGAAYGAYVMAG